MKEQQIPVKMWVNEEGYVWFTDENNNFLGENVRDIVAIFKNDPRYSGQLGFKVVD